MGRFPTISHIPTLADMTSQIIPNYPLPEHESKIEILRVVVRESCSSSMVDRLIEDLISTVETLIAATDTEMNALAGKVLSGAVHGSGGGAGNDHKLSSKGKKAGTQEHEDVSNLRFLYERATDK